MLYITVDFTARLSWYIKSVFKSVSLVLETEKTTDYITKMNNLTIYRFDEL